jgi:DNA-binding transcriptional regulator YiaG
VSAGPSVREAADWVASVGAKDIRERCGITAADMARALRVTGWTISNWEDGTYAPAGEKGRAYVRVMRGLARHLEIPEEPT